MNAKVIKVQEKPSKYGGKFYYIFFKGEKDGKSYRTCVFPQCRNFGKWRELINKFKKDDDFDWIAVGLKVKKGNLLDADILTRFNKVGKQDDLLEYLTRKEKSE